MSQAANGKNANLTRVLTILAGGAMLALQGVNLSEVASGNAQGNQRMDVLQHLVRISEDQTNLLEASKKILENGTLELARDEESLTNQTKILNTLNRAIDERREILKDLVSPTPAKENH